MAQSESIEMLESRGFFPKEPDHEVEKATIRASGGAALTKKKEAKRSAASFMTQQSMLLRREKNSLVRSPAPMIANVTITAVLALIFGVIFFGIGREDRTDLLVSLCGAICFWLHVFEMFQQYSSSRISLWFFIL